MQPHGRERTMHLLLSCQFFLCLCCEILLATPSARTVGILLGMALVSIYYAIFKVDM